MTTDFTAKRHQIENALDSCGIGHDVQDRIDKAVRRISILVSNLNIAAIHQAVYDTMTNRPYGIKNDSPGKDDAERAFVTAAISTLSRMVEWDICDARRIAADILEDVNDHDKAGEVREWANADVVEDLNEQ